MIAQVAVTVICLPAAMGIGEEAWRDRRIRAHFPGHEYLAVRIGLDQDMAAGESDAEFAVRANNTYAELERRLGQEAGVAAVTFAEQLPACMAKCVGGIRRGGGSEPIPIPNLWTSTVAPRSSPRSIARSLPDAASLRAIFGGARRVIVNGVRAAFHE
jgi:hypothetical protein